MFKDVILLNLNMWCF